MSEFPETPIPPVQPAPVQPLPPQPMPPQQYTPAPPAQNNNNTKWIIGGCAGCGCLTLLGILAFIVLASVLRARENQGEGNSVTPPTGTTTAPQDGTPTTEETTPPTNNDNQASAPADDIQNSVGQCATDPKDGMLYGRVEAVETDATTGEKTYRIAGEGGTIWHKKVENVRVGPCP